MIRFTAALMVILVAATALAADRSASVTTIQHDDATKVSFQWKQIEGPLAAFEDPTAGERIGRDWVSGVKFTTADDRRCVFEVTITYDYGRERKDDTLPLCETRWVSSPSDKIDLDPRSGMFRFRKALPKPSLRKQRAVARSLSGERPNER